MKRKLASLVIVTLVIIALSKLFVVIAANKVVANMKDQLVPVGALSYESVSTSLFEGYFTVKSPNFKHFKLKWSASAAHSKVGFSGGVGMIWGLITALGGDFDSVQTINFEQLTTDLPDAEFYDRLSEDIRPPVGLWFGWQTCDGGMSPQESLLESIGLESLNAEVLIYLKDGRSSLEFDFEALGRVIFQANLREAIRGLPFQLAQVQYVENGYFRRLANACVTNSSEEVSRKDLANGIVDAWQQTLIDNNYRISEGATRLLESYVDGGGTLTLTVEALPVAVKKKTADKAKVQAEDQENVSAKNESEEVVYGWQAIQGNPKFSLELNGQKTESLGLEIYVPPPEPEEEVIEEPVREPQYQASDINELESYKGKRVRVVLKNDKEFEGTLSDVTTHEMTITPFEGDGRIAYTLKRSDLLVLEVWSR